MFFQIHNTPKSEKKPSIAQQEPIQPAVLVLGPFQPQTRITLETTANSQISTELIIKNPSTRTVNIKVTKRPPLERSFILSFSDVTLEPHSETIIIFTWTPKEVGCWRETLQFTENRRVKYDVALTLTCNNVKICKTKGSIRSRVLVQSNEISNTNNGLKKVSSASAISINEQNSTVNSKYNGNKENIANKNNLETRNMKTPPRNIHTTIDGKQNNMNKLDVSHFELTPINAYHYMKSVKIPHLRVTDTTLSNSILNNVEQTNTVQKEESSDSIDFQSGVCITSPENTECGTSLRRETYLNPHPKFCEKMIVVDEENNESFDDSLSPRKSMISNTKTNQNFSTVLDDIVHFTTSLKSISPTACSTEYKSDSDSHRIFDDSSPFAISNNTFDIITVDNLVKTPLTESGNSCESPKSALATSGSMKPSRLATSFAIISPNSKTLNAPKINSASSPILDHRRTTFGLSTKQATDVTSVKEVLEADLWANADHSNHPLGTTSSHEVINNSSEMISEENVTVEKKMNIGMNHEKFITIWRKSSNFRVGISPPQKNIANTHRIVATKKISPITHNKITKNKTTTQYNQTPRKKISMSHTSKQRSCSSVAGTKITQLCLTNLNATTVNKNKSTKAAFVGIDDTSKTCSESKITRNTIKMPNSNDIISSIRNRDPFSVAMTEDPFLSHNLYYDYQWIHDRELEFTKWLNKLLTPPEHSADVENGCVDVGKIWQSCRAKENVTLAETKETVSARYNTNERLNTLRKAACAMFARDEVKMALAPVVGCIDKGIFVIRQDRDLHRDIGLQKAILELLLNYNPLWLRIGLEVVYGETIPLNSNNDYIGLTRFLIARFFSDPYLVQTYSHPNVIYLKLPVFQTHMNKFLLKKFLFIVYFLDYAKRNKLIGHDPCLFHKKATNKDSRAILLTFSREVLSGVGDLTKVLRTHGYVVSHKQTYLDEYNYAVKDISSDLRDGVRLCRVMELIIGSKTLTSQCRVPPISRLQKIFNVDLALKALIKAGYQIAGDIDARSIVEGHREKTLSLLWQIIYKFQRPRFEKAANCLQKWWRAMLWYVRIKSLLSQHRNNSACIIQRVWRCYRAKKITQVLREERKQHLKNIEESVRIIQLRWIQRRIMLHDRQNFMRMKTATIRIQKWFRRIKASQPYVEDFHKKRQAVMILQTQFRATIAMRRERTAFRKTKQATMIIQRWWRATSLRHSMQNYYQKLQTMVIFIQSKWRAQRLMKIERNCYMEKQKAIVNIQIWWRSIIIAKRYRNNYIIQKNAVKIIKSWWIGRKLMYIEREKFLLMKNSAIKIQHCWRKYRCTKNYILLFNSYRKAANTIQKWWRSAKIAREYRTIRNSTIIIQRWWRSLVLTRKTASTYSLMKKSAINVQKTWKMKVARKKYNELKNAAIIIQTQWRAHKLTITARQNFVTLKNAAITIQRHYHSLYISRKIRNEYLITYQATLKIQRAYRALRMMQRTRNQYIEYRNAVICVQSIWRMIRIRREYHSKIHAILIIQRKWRSVIITRNIRKQFLALRRMTIFMQRRYRLKKIARKIRQEQSAEYAENRIRYMAATRIQAAWRGYKIRMLQSAEIHELRQRSKKAAAAATPSTTVEHRLQVAMDLLQNFTNIGQLSMCLACIDTLTRLSPKGCILFCELNLVDRLYLILEKANRSLPWLEVCKRCSNILITLAKLPKTSSRVCNIEETETLVRLMTVAIKYDVDLFLHLATLFWLLLNNPQFAAEVMNSERTLWLFKSLIGPAAKKESAMKMECKNVSFKVESSLLPNVKPDWGLKTRRPRCFSTIQHAMSSLKEKLNIASNF